MKKVLFVGILFSICLGMSAQTQNYEGGVEYKQRRGTGKVNITPGATSVITINTNAKIQSDGTKIDFLVGGVNRLSVNGSKTVVIPITSAKRGAVAGWEVADTLNTYIAKLPASQTAATLILPIAYPLKIGSTITGYSLIGQIESAGATVTLSANLRKHAAAAADIADASVANLASNVSVTADAILSATNASKTGILEVVAADETFYLLITGTTAALTDIALQGVTLTITE